MKKIILLLIMLLLLLLNSMPNEAKTTEPVPLPDLKKPQQLTIHDGRIFITENTSIYIYSLKNHKLLKRFGAAGEGPQEFKLNPFGPGLQLFPCPEGLLINSDGKVSFFTTTGKFIREIKVKPYGLFAPLGKNYVGNGSAPDNAGRMNLNINLYNANFNKIKEFHHTRKTIGTGLYSNLLLETIDLPYEAFTYPVYKNKVFIAHETEKEGLIIKAFNSSGEKKLTIIRPYDKQKVSENYKKKMRDWFKNRSPLKPFWGRIKNVIRFKLFFPLLKNMLVDDGRIYVLTYTQKQGQYECLVFDMKGKEHPRVLLPLPQEEPFAPVLYTIKNKRFYSLTENEDTETWELRVNKIH